jgi:wyosine [tRNA(Phe)-imidazoG37] synthetase (radical SAM superfamily)
MAGFTFGPVPSRRLGFSLGVDALPRKYCTFDCVYCQIGKTTDKVATRQHFFDPHRIVREIVDSVTASEHTDIITFSGSGEPTLNTDLGLMIKDVKRLLNLPVAVITNASLLHMEDVRGDLMAADIILPSLDAVSEETFRLINRPHPLLQLHDMIEGLRLLGKEYKGEIWLEIMLIRGVNDTVDELTKFKKILRNIRVDKIQLNTVIRPPEGNVESPIEADELHRISRYLGRRCEVICGFERSVKKRRTRNWTKMVLEVLVRRSLSLDDIVRITGVPAGEVQTRLTGLVNRGLIRSFHFGSTLFYVNNAGATEPVDS